MGQFSKWLHMVGWLLKSLFLKLPPTRRLLFVIAIALMLFSPQFHFANDNLNVNFHFNILAVLVFLFILMLELKDKLIAREELQAGHAVQLALLPVTPPVIPGWDTWLFTRPANDVGGDMVDYMELDGGQYIISLADISGKGLPAALLMAKLQATIRAVAPDYDQLSNLCCKINEIFHRDTLPKSFSSLVLLKLFETENKIEIMNAGHLPPIIIKNDKIESLPKTSPAIGIIPKAEFISQTKEFNSGDILFVYTDGLTEARNIHGEFLGDELLLKLISRFKAASAQEFGRKLLDKIEMFVGEARAHDDLSMIVMKKL
jgi:sigma-B regulation protein RsbU (phosphoserine phosphatase)